MLFIWTKAVGLLPSQCGHGCLISSRIFLLHAFSFPFASTNMQCDVIVLYLLLNDCLKIFTYCICCSRINVLRNKKLHTPETNLVLIVLMGSISLREGYFNKEIWSYLSKQSQGWIINNRDVTFSADYLRTRYRSRMMLLLLRYSYSRLLAL